MACLVVRYRTFFFRIEDERFLFKATNNTLDGLLKMDNYNMIGVGASSYGNVSGIPYKSFTRRYTDQGSLVDTVGNVCAGEARRESC